MTGRSSSGSGNSRRKRSSGGSGSDSGIKIIIGLTISRIVKTGVLVGHHNHQVNKVL